MVRAPLPCHRSRGSCGDRPRRLPGSTVPDRAGTVGFASSVADAAVRASRRGWVIQVELDDHVATAYQEVFDDGAPYPGYFAVPIALANTLRPFRCFPEPRPAER